MNRVIVVMSISLVALAVGCAPSPDSLVKQQVDCMNDMADAIEDGASEKEVEKLKTRAESISEKLDEMELTEEEKRELFERHREEIEAAMRRLQEAALARMTNNLKEGMMGPGGSGFPSFPTGQ